ncbi:DNA repair protein RecO [Patescibacteria group bacterium]|nr:DNA repair protein RecO [Patescibacteria group bacterium]
MALQYRTQGFVLSKTDSGEADRLFTLFTSDFGKINVLGRAIRKIASKLRGGLEIGSFSEIEFIQGKTYKTLTDAFILNNYPSLKSNPLKLKTAYKIAQVTNSLSVEDKEVFNLIKTAYEGIDSDDPSAYQYFIWNFFSVLGYKPELERCIVCQRKTDLCFFSPEEGGSVCSFCRKGYKTDEKTLKAISTILRKETLKDIPLGIRDLANNYYLYLLSVYNQSI